MNMSENWSGHLDFHREVSSPDFYLPDYDVYVNIGNVERDNEYDRSKYTHAMKYKMARYQRTRHQVYFNYPDNMKNLDWVFRKKFEKVTGIKLPRK